MSPLHWKTHLTAIASLTCSLVLTAGFLAAQTSTQTESTPAERAAARKAAVKAAAEKRAAARSGSARAASTAADSRTAKSKTSPAAAASPLTTNAVPTGTVPPRTPPSAATGVSPGSATSGSPSYASGLGTFLAGVWTLTAYGCYRSGTRLFCDFDLSGRNNGRANASLYSLVKLVDDGGRMTLRHNAFYLGTDGSQLSTVFVSPGSPVRMIMEYDDIPQSDTSVSLVFRTDRIPSVPVTAVNSSQPAGTIPARGAATSQGTPTGAEPKTP